MSGLVDQLEKQTISFNDFEVVFADRLIDCNLDPELAKLRYQSYLQGSSILEANMQSLRDQDYESVPLAIDVLGTARMLRQTREEHGRNSEQYKSQLISLTNDSKRLIAESKRKNTWEHFPKLRRDLDEASGSYYANGTSIIKTVANGLSPASAAEEQQIRVLEYVEEVTHSYVGTSSLAAEGVSLLTIKECPDYVIEDYQTDRKSPHAGYAPAVKKLVLQNVEFSSDGRNDEHLAVPGIYITHDLIVETLKERQAIGADEQPTKLDLRAKQFLSNSENGLIGLISALDQKASERSGRNIFMGEVVDEQHPKDYTEAIKESRDRQLAQEEEALRVRELLMNLEAKKTDSALAEIILGTYLKETMFDEAIDNPELAAIMFDQVTADGIAEAHRLRKAGLDIDANKLIKGVFTQAPAISFCGAGSCGLEAAAQGDAESIKASQLGLKGDQIVDKERSCPNPSCGQKKIRYDMSGSKVCTACGNKDIKA